jgi:hypothetical protein
MEGIRLLFPDVKLLVVAVVQHVSVNIVDEVGQQHGGK